MILYGNSISPYVRHCQIVLDVSGINYKLVDNDMSASAVGSPMQRIPYLHDGELELYDSTSILHYLREQSGQRFLPSHTDTEYFALATTVLDTLMNLLLLERSGFTDTDNTFITRQLARVQTGLTAIENTPELLDVNDQDDIDKDDARLRLACLLDWAIFRKRLSLEMYPKQQQFLSTMRTWQPFADTAPS